MSNNRPDAKLKILHLLLQIRNENGKGGFVFKQNKFLVNLSSMWDIEIRLSTVRHDGCVYIFGIIVSITGS